MNDRPVSLIETPADLVELVMTQHWDMHACPCTFCEAGRMMGLRPHTGFKAWRSQHYDYMAPVRNVDGVTRGSGR